MAWRAARALGVTCRLVKALEISQGGLLGKAKGGESDADVLLVPGGSARLKAQALGADGIEAIRRWVCSGGTYIGFCGGAGLALSSAMPQLSLGVCPWSRRAYASVSEHHISGHVRVFLAGADQSPFALQAAATSGIERCLPVWWPGRFAWRKDDEVHILARYAAPMEDLWVGDAPFCERSRGSGACAGIAHLRNEPVLVHGKCGKGNYILSYAHLESPASPLANIWLAQILAKFGLPGNGRCSVPEWETGPRQRGVHAPCACPAGLSSFGQAFRQIIAAAQNGALFFPRKPWLLGWRAGLPGAVCNNLITALATLEELIPNDRMDAYWQRKQTVFLRLADSFICEAEKYFRDATPQNDAAVDTEARKTAGMRNMIFGSPMAGGGLAGRVLEILEEIIWLGA